MFRMSRLLLEKRASAYVRGSGGRSTSSTSITLTFRNGPAFQASPVETLPILVSQS